MSVAIIFKLLLDMGKATLFQIGWKIVLERFWSRLVAHGLRKIADMNTNELITETAEDILNDLSGKKLPEIK